VVVPRLWLAAALAFAAFPSIPGEVVVAVPLSMQPYFLPIQGRGLAYDAIQAAFASRGHTVRPLYVSSRRIEDLITDDSRADCVPMVSPGSEHGWEVTESIHLLHDVAVTRSGVRMSTIDDLKNKRILAYSGATRVLGDGFRSAVTGNRNYREVNNHRAQVRLLLHGVIDVIIADRLLVSWYLDYLRQEGDTIPEVVVHDLFEPVALEFICRTKEIAGEFSAGLVEVLKDGTLKGILAQYGGTEGEAIFRPREGQSPVLNSINTPLEAPNGGE
jgi:polar amino acid transport system substrate-binding protein